jgi:hypothetical protein
MSGFCGEVLLALCPVTKLEDHPLSAVHNCLFSMWHAMECLQNKLMSALYTVTYYNVFNFCFYLFCFGVLYHFGLHFCLQETVHVLYCYYIGNIMKLNMMVH